MYILTFLAIVKSGLNQQLRRERNRHRASFSTKNSTTVSPLTNHAGHEAPDLFGDLEDVRHRGGVDQPVLRKKRGKKQRRTTFMERLDSEGLVRMNAEGRRGGFLSEAYAFRRRLYQAKKAEPTSVL